MSKILCAVLAVVLCRDAGAAPVSLESAQAYVRATAGTNASNVILYSTAEATKIIDTVFKLNRGERRRRLPRKGKEETA